MAQSSVLAELNMDGISDEVQPQSNTKLEKTMEHEPTIEVQAEPKNNCDSDHFANNMEVPGGTAPETTSEIQQEQWANMEHEEIQAEPDNCGNMAPDLTRRHKHRSSRRRYGSYQRSPDLRHVTIFLGCCDMQRKIHIGKTYGYQMYDLQHPYEQFLRTQIPKKHISAELRVHFQQVCESIFCRYLRSSIANIRINNIIEWCRKRKNTKCIIFGLHGCPFEVHTLCRYGARTATSHYFDMLDDRSSYTQN